MKTAWASIDFLWEEAVAVAADNPNINFDLAEIAPTVIRGGKLENKEKYKDHTPEFLNILDIMRNRLQDGCSRILFGTHYPISPMETFKG
jgi:hypothetical protein